VLIRERYIDLVTLKIPRKSIQPGVSLLKEECTIRWPLQLPVLYSAVPRLTGEKQISFKASGFSGHVPQKANEARKPS
jgi:hypothetical protein